MDLLRKLHNINSSSDCCHTDNACSSGLGKIILVGAPNVGKSALFNELTNSYVTVSNYPGTTVGISRATASIDGKTYEVVDTPGMYSFLPVTEEEKISRKMILGSRHDTIIHVIDAKNIERMLPLTLQLMETGLPVILVLNLMDELKSRGMRIDVVRLEKELGIPVLPAVATKGQGIDGIRKAVIRYKAGGLAKGEMRGNLSNKVRKVSELLKNSSIAASPLQTILLLEEEEDEVDFIKLPDAIIREISAIKTDDDSTSYPFFYEMALERQNRVSQIVSRVLTSDKSKKLSFRERLSELMVNPWSGIPILLAVMYVGLYQIVGQFGAGTVVDFIESIIFEKYINPFFVHYVPLILPWKLLSSLFIGEYGVITLGLRYAVAIILPIVGTFFFVFALIEDSGYLPRLAMLIDRVFKKIGLSGRAVIPLVLGLGCSTMATMVTRTLPTKRERVMATILLALAVPCSAQLGVLFTMLVGYPTAMLMWLGVVLCVFLLVGYLGAKLLPGNPPVFFMEVPPLRIPTLSNVATKTYARIVWYLKEVFPLFIFASLVLWLGQVLGLFKLLVTLLNYPVTLIGLPKETAVAYLFGFFRRDFGAAGLYDMQRAGFFTTSQLLIAVTTMTLFPACIAQGLTMIRERGKNTGISIFVFCVAAAFVIGFLMNLIFNYFHIRL